jgi:ethanolamine utilization protein EutM
MAEAATGTNAIPTLTTQYPKPKTDLMASKAIGLLETRGLTALVTGVDAMLKSANVTLAGPMKGVGNALVSAVVVGDVAAVKAATDAGAQAARTVGEVVSVQVIPRPHDDVTTVLPKTPAAATAKK